MRAQTLSLDRGIFETSCDSVSALLRAHRGEMSGSITPVGGRPEKVMSSRLLTMKVRRKESIPLLANYNVYSSCKGQPLLTRTEVHPHPPFYLPVPKVLMDIPQSARRRLPPFLHFPVPAHQLRALSISQMALAHQFHKKKVRATRPIIMAAMKLKRPGYYISYRALMNDMTIARRSNILLHQTQ